MEVVSISEKYIYFQRQSALITACDSKSSCANFRNRSFCSNAYYPLATLSSGQQIVGSTGVGSLRTCESLISDHVIVLTNPYDIEDAYILTFTQFFLKPLMIVIATFLFCGFTVFSIVFPEIKRDEKAQRR